MSIIISEPNIPTTESFLVCIYLLVRYLTSYNKLILTYTTLLLSVSSITLTGPCSRYHLFCTPHCACLYEERESWMGGGSLNTGCDGIPSVLVKRVMHVYIKPLTLIINKALYDGIFPKEPKLAKVIPIYKAGTTMELNN